MQHVIVDGTCKFCGAANPAPQEDCIDEHPVTVPAATINAVKLAMVEHCYTSDNDIPWHTLVDTLALAVYRSLVNTSKRRYVPITVTVRSDNRTVLYNATTEAHPGRVPLLVQDALMSIDQTSGYSLTVSVPRADMNPDEIIELTLRRELPNLRLRSAFRVGQTANLIVQKIDSWRKNGRL